MGKVMKARQRGENPQAGGQGSALQREADGADKDAFLLYNKESVDPEDMSKMYNNSQTEMLAT